MSTLAEDLKNCRKRLNISLEEISKNTRVPVSLFASIEDGSFFSNPGFTRTYIRSFARMYGKAIKLDETDIVKALDEHEAEMYSGFLYKKYVLGEVEKPIVPPPIPVQREQQPAAAPALEPKRHVIEVPTPKPEPQRTPIENDRSVDWADMNARINRPHDNSQATTYMLIALAVILAAAAFIYFVYNPFAGNQAASDLPPTTTEPTPQVVTPQENVTPVQPNPPAPILTLPDTLKVIVYALNDKLDPVRITSDLKDRVNPYWIERGAAREFDFRDTLIVRADPTRFALIYNGHLIATFGDFRFDDDSLNFRLTRSLLMQRAESQRPGTLPDNVRPPVLDF